MKQPKTSKPAKPVKPTGLKCDLCTEGYLVERTNSKTKNTFLGCSEWPDCPYTERGGSNPIPNKKKQTRVPNTYPCGCKFDDTYADDPPMYYADLYGDVVDISDLY